MANSVASVQTGAPEYQDRGHTQAQAHPNQKVGMVDKIKGMLPGGQTQTHSTQTAHSNPTQKVGMVDKIKGMLPGSQTQTGTYNQNQKPGMMDKIKAKIPGGQSK